MGIVLTPTTAAELAESGVAGSDSFLQTPFWAEFKASHGWKPFYFILNAEPDRRFPLIALSRTLGRFGSFAYIAMGPPPEVLNAGGVSSRLEEISAALASYLPRTTVFIRFDPPWEGKADIVQSLHLRKASGDVQPPDTVLIDLAKTESQILEDMKPKWRYNVRLGEKKGVEIRMMRGREAADIGMESFWKLYQETAERDSIAIHGRDYYRNLFLASCEGPFPADVRLYLAEHEGEALAAIVTLFGPWGATYLYGASSNEKRNLMPAYALQWRAMRDAKQAECPRYDLYGIPPSDDPKHPMHGLYRFKTGFGGVEVHRCGSLDFPIKPFRYALWRRAEGLRAFWYKGVKKFLKKGIARRS